MMGVYNVFQNIEESVPTVVSGTLEQVANFAGHMEDQLRDKIVKEHLDRQKQMQGQVSYLKKTLAEGNFKAKKEENIRHRIRLMSDSIMETDSKIAYVRHNPAYVFLFEEISVLDLDTFEET